MPENPHNPYAAPSSGGAPHDDRYVPALFSLRGRIGRGRYLAYLLFPACGMMLLFAPLAMFRTTLALLFPLLALLSLLTLMTVRRLDDLDRSRWWCLLAWAPLLNGMMMLYLLCAPGNPRANRHGPAPTGGVQALTQAAWLFVAALPCIAFLLYAFARLAMLV